MPPSLKLNRTFPPKRHRRPARLEVEMRLLAPLFVVLTFLFIAGPVSAEIVFTCHAQKADECAFSVVHADGSGMTNFVLSSNQSHSLSDSFAGSKYCVVVSRPRAQIKDWPEKCTNSVTGAPGKIVVNIKAGATYD